MQSQSAIVSSLLALALGCASLATYEPARIPIPSGLSAEDAQLSILLAIAAAPEDGPPSLVPNATDARGILVAQALDGIRRSAHSSHPWFVEDQGPTWVRAGVNVRTHYLSVRYEVGPDTISERIVRSANLEQSGNRIHGNAILWLEDLRARIRRNISIVLAYRAASAAE